MGVMVTGGGGGGFRYPFHSHVTAAARKKSLSFCQKCRWQVTARHTCPPVFRFEMTLYTGALLYGIHRTCAETAAVPRCTKRALKYTASAYIQRVQSFIQNREPVWPSGKVLGW